MILFKILVFETVWVLSLVPEFLSFSLRLQNRKLWFYANSRILCCLILNGTQQISTLDKKKLGGGLGTLTFIYYHLCLCSY